MSSPSPRYAVAFCDGSRIVLRKGVSDTNFAKSKASELARRVSRASEPFDLVSLPAGDTLASRDAKGRWSAA